VPSIPSPAPATVTSLDFQGCGIVETRGDTITGFVGSSAERDVLQRQARTLGIAKVDVSLRPWPQCEALMTLQRGLKATDQPRIRVQRTTNDVSLVDGAPFLIEVESPAAEHYLQVTYIQADGRAVHLLQPDNLSLRPVAARSRLVLGDGRDGGPRFTVSSPFGAELLIVVASAAPLFATPRPQVETERNFLSALRAAVIARPDPSLAPRAFSAAFDAVHTVARRP
jgi:hypothetical protein